MAGALAFTLGAPTSLSAHTRARVDHPRAQAEGLRELDQAQPETLAWVETHEGGAASHTDMSHASPNDVLSHNTAIAGKVQALTGKDAQSACDGFKNLGQCVAAAHVARNLDIPRAFDALKAKVTGTDAVSLGKAIEQLSPQANAKGEQASLR